MDGWIIDQRKVKEAGFRDAGDWGSEMCHFSPKKASLGGKVKALLSFNDTVALHQPKLYNKQTECMNTHWLFSS